MGVRVLIARICRGNWERTEIGSWLAHCLVAAAKDPRISYINDVVQDRCPTDAARNEVVLFARSLEIDILFMVDHDNVPNPEWFSFGLDYITRNPASVVASPYCGSRPSVPGNPDRDVQVTVRDKTAPAGRRRITRNEAVKLTGVQPAYGVGTVLAIGMPVFDMIDPPWFAYKYHDKFHSQAGTEDFTFSEAVSDAGGSVMVNWDCWTGHNKSETIRKPEPEIRS